MTYVWKPSEEYLSSSNVARLMRRLGVDSADELRARSVADIGAFWDGVVEDLDIPFRTPYSRTVDATRGIEHAEWYVDGEPNAADACVGKWTAQTPDAAAVVHEAEDGSTRSISFAELADRVARVRAGLRGLGLGKGAPSRSTSR